VPFVTDTFLRRAEQDDLNTMVAWMEESDFQHFLYGDPARSTKQIREQIVGMLGRPPGHTMPGGIYLVVDSKVDGLIGMISLQNLSWRNRSCSIDIYIGERQKRSRFVTATAIYRTLEYCFDELNLHRVSAYIYAFNEASWRIFEFAGAKREVTLPQHVARDGEHYDMYCYGLLRSEFDTLKKRYAEQMEGVSLEAMIKDLASDDAEPAH
jgi:RimJ/RimL family protein N-acetyltransferase